MPAALGGLRAHNTLLCGTHNRSFGRTLDPALAKDLAYFNAQLGVRSAHTGQAASVRIRAADTGTEFVVSDGRMAPAGTRVLEDQKIDGVRNMRVVFTDRDELEEYKRKLLAEGKPVTFTEFIARPIVAGHHTYNHHFGGQETLREAARVGLNFLAREFPEVARHHGLSACKAWILDGGEGDFVRFEFIADFIDEASVGGQNAFPFGHRVIVGCDAGSGEAFARLSFFGAFEMAVRFGTITTTETVTVVTDVDPLAAQAGQGDLDRRRFDQCIGRPTFEHGQADPSQELSRRLHALNARIRTHQWQQLEDPLIAEVNAVAELAPRARAARLDEVLSPYAQRVYNLALHVNRAFHRDFRADHGDEAYASVQAQFTAWDALVEGDETKEHGLTPLAYDVICHIRRALGSYLAEHLPIDGENLRFVLEGSVGAAEASKVLAVRVRTEFPHLFVDGAGS